MLSKYYLDRIDPYTLFDPFQIFSDVARPRSGSTLQSRVNYNVTTNDAGLVLKVDLPGVKKEDLKVEVSDRTLHIKGKRDQEDISIAYKISKDFSADDPDAKLEDGVLSLNFRKLSESGTKTIVVK
jgi:HSP20 family molecular chaperone IbpA